MKKTIPLMVLLLLTALNSFAFAGGNFDRMKTLVGEWEATTPERKIRVTYQLISNGTALIKTIVTENMVTVYHPDGDSVMMTHYCAVGNQLRMRAQGSGNGPIAFQYIDTANLKSPSDGHMYRLVIKFQDADHVTQEWTWKEGGKETTTAFHLQRVK